MASSSPLTAQQSWDLEIFTKKCWNSATNCYHGDVATYSLINMYYCSWCTTINSITVLGSWCSIFWATLNSEWLVWKTSALLCQNRVRMASKDWLLFLVQLVPVEVSQHISKHVISPHPITGWWFGIFSIFLYIGNNNPNWLIFFRWVETTNRNNMSLWCILGKKHVATSL